MWVVIAIRVLFASGWTETLKQPVSLAEVETNSGAALDILGVPQGEVVWTPIELEIWSEHAPTQHHCQRAAQILRAVLGSVSTHRGKVLHVGVHEYASFELGWHSVASLEFLLLLDWALKQSGLVR